ncbi:hypothetical protein RDI58_023396 [Solanum bulbocastanum]|uniref:F-box domain-containing protein n=1 Tax=Solanum bulbocastanum TaxID=147425 RepID=A0AAN8Y6N1_SOLBU
MEHSIFLIADDIIYSILIMLCVKSLIRFQYVSKSWKNIIGDKIFRKVHHNRSKSSSSSKKSFLFATIDGVYEFRPFENPQVILIRQKFPLKRFQHVPTLGSCDGMVLLKSHLGYKSFALWNPYSNEYRIYECPYVKTYSFTTPHACGFCYDPYADDYKVILIYRSFYAVYSLIRKSWEKKSSVHVKELNVRSWDCSPGINTENRVFWSIEWKIHQLVGRNSKIIYFDVKSDELKELPKPDFIRENNQLYRLTSLKGCVGLFGGIISSKTFDVWIMEQHEWKLSLTVTCIHYALCGPFVKNSVILVDETNHDEILFHIRTAESQYCAIYDLERHRFVNQINMFNNLRYYMVPIFSESLYFPKIDTKRKRLS